MAAAAASSDPRPKPQERSLIELCSELQLTQPGTEAKVTGITHDSRRVKPGDLYAALPGANFHGAEFARQALRCGAAAILTDSVGKELVASNAEGQIPVVVVDDPRAVLGAAAAWIYGYPARDLQMIGITGTDGKTTTAMLVEGALNSLGISTGLVGTIATRVGNWSAASARTTPEASDLQALLAFMREQGAKAAVLEVSSHALELGRADSILFDMAIFTNLGLDHLDFHGTQESYFAAKAKLFTPERARRAVICANDGWGVNLLASAQIPGEAYVVEGIQETNWPAGTSEGAAKTWQATKLELLPTGWSFTLAAPAKSADKQISVAAGTKLFGRYNVANATAAVAAVSWVSAQLEGHAVPTVEQIEQAAQAVAASSGAPGRMESVQLGQDFTMLVDYAHTPDAVANALANVSDLAESTGGKVIAVIGCGGDRDPSKRPTMGQITVQHADVAIVTDDNPRSEDPAEIRRQILEGIGEIPQNYRAAVVEEIGDRRAAVRRAVSLAGPGDVVIALGKGHELGQEVNGKILPMDDRELLASSLPAPD